MKYAAMFFFLLWSALGRADEESSVRISQSDGTVEIVKGSGAAKQVKEGDAIERGDRLLVRDKSAALLMWSNGSMVKVYPNSEIALAGVSFDLEKKMEKTLVDLEKGRIFVKAQVPEHLFSEFRVRIGGLDLRTQGAEFALAYDAEKKSVTAWSLMGRLVADVGVERLRIDDGQQATIAAAGKPGASQALDDKVKQSLTKTSRDLGGSLLQDESAGASGGKLAAKIGGVAARRGSTPFKVGFKAAIKGGSGKIKSIAWDFGDGESASTKDVEHTFTQGLYVVILRVEDENGEKASAQTGISVEADCGC
ncbi:MAG: PKD domain-containing protein [Betaproteobacteria bacterium]|nr:PKD domain-containing protein [Betaproteobacteria bacterium]